MRRLTLFAATVWPTVAWAATRQPDVFDRIDDAGNDIMAGLAMLVVGGAVIALVIAGYFLPTIIAFRRSLNAAGALFVVNLLFGWTLVFWLVCLIWAANGRTEAQDEFYRRAVAGRDGAR